jgi:transposase
MTAPPRITCLIASIHHHRSCRQGNDADGIRNLIEARGAVPNIPPKSNRKWKPCFSKSLYRERNLVERFFSTQALPSDRYSIRQARRELLRDGPARLNAAVAPRLRVRDLEPILPARRRRIGVPDQ